MSEPLKLEKGGAPEVEAEDIDPSAVRYNYRAMTRAAKFRRNDELGSTGLVEYGGHIDEE